MRRARWREHDVPDPPTVPLRLPEPEEREAYRVLNLALRLGDILLSSGAGAGDVTATIRAVTAAAGLARCDADVTYTSISISYLRGPDAAPVTASRVVWRRGLDGTRLSEIHNLVGDLVQERIGLGEAQERLDAIRRAPHPYPRWGATLAWAGLAASVAVLLGGHFVVAAIAFGATVVIDRLNRALNARNVPFFYQNIAGGVIATASAIGLAAADISVTPSLVVASGIVVLLPGMLLVGSVQDAITGFMVTASARVLEVLLLTAGLLTGVALALDVGARLGVVIEVTDIATPLVSAPIRIVAAGVAAGCYSLANYAPRRAVTATALAGGLGFAVLEGLAQVHVGRTTAAAVSAIIIGLGSQVLADRQRLAPLLLVVPAIIPQLPGLTIFRALLALSSGDSGPGLALLLSALTTGLALAAGVIFGEIIAQPVRREVSRFERRSGPRLIGAVRRRHDPGAR